VSARRVLSLHPERFAVCRFPADDPLPAWVFHDDSTLWSVTRTPREMSVVCPEDDLPPAVERAERGWRAFEIDGPVPFAETGVIAGLATPLAAAGIPLFVLSTYDTDLVLVKEIYVERAAAVFASAGYEVRGK
jgi:hypothetical protein